MSTVLSESIADALRIVTVIELSFAVGLSIAVMAIYFTVNQQDPHVGSAPIRDLPRYVIGMAISYNLLAAFAAAEIQGYIGTPLTWRTPIGFIGATIGIYALWVMLSIQNTRARRPR